MCMCGYVLITLEKKIEIIDLWIHTYIETMISLKRAHFVEMRTTQLLLCFLYCFLNFQLASIISLHILNNSTFQTLVNKIITLSYCCHHPMPLRLHLKKMVLWVCNFFFDKSVELKMVLAIWKKLNKYWIFGGSLK